MRNAVALTAKRASRARGEEGCTGILEVAGGNGGLHRGGMSESNLATAVGPSSASAESAARSHETPKAAALRILIVDDEQTIRLTLGLCLEAEGHAVAMAASAQSALDEVSHRAFDLIFLDLRLGLDNGLDLIPRLLHENPRAKGVVITAYDTVERAVEAMKGGAMDYRPKPFTPVEVQLVTQKVAERRRLEWQVEALQEAMGRLDPEVDLPTETAAMQQA